ncbi:Anti-sigma-28 factor [Azotobacter vinelandii CA]|uniref:Negative regulator of flagellin synthesis n=2 Tax=Azotobacter vinelandii TaxID=354 RepID=C1DHJ0_AZOVD|nr:flagellar biosynthesis anti-sigma factor FlgM [Azotobacter vinelandii]ACO78585.1 Anti-sigma-28 factor [Azotobacter vinelandii DJ]AGK13482.1 Anti-sigma-28 factor [Azotobacter vinelandii CA]AGK17895.1 Anti-sigma-28 factor [Azotobacter vinelandii CA6]WKN24267.1 flagellar biosynthesis anti-sigma factor FlgM [Azotobacter vinelandii]SFX89477.1 anti-sigma-28 factor, FlgM family [Azotobacter vinelandii]
MKIDNSSTPPGAARPTDNREAGPRIQRDAPASRTESPAVVAHIGQSAETDATRDIDMARVVEIRQAIGEGRLQIRAERIAGGLIDSVRELLGDGA